MFLKNYTSEVPVSQTVYRIEQVLIKCGAAGITKEYADTAGTLLAVAFQIETPNGKMNIRLPVDVNRAWDALWLDYVDGDQLTKDGTKIYYNNRKRKVKNDFKQQAERTAWKIVQDWVEVQMSMIQLKQAEVLQVFMPYVVTNNGESMYQRLTSPDGAVGMRLLLGEGSAP